jgi:cellulose synthase/poly-beta-1,6-N-acetylglucosamine synthase-like glycosyltransferase
MVETVFNTATIIMLAVYGISLLFIFFYSLVQIDLVHLYLRSKKNERAANPSLKPISNYPPITVQLPIYNEMYVVSRLINCVAAFNYPRDRLEVQVLDDSTDETSDLIAIKVREMREKGFDILHLKRDNRAGFKAGALANGLAQAKGDFIAIFDADFIPPDDFLLRTLSFFNDSKVGMVQTKWDHINEDYSLLTVLQAYGLDAHFTVEQRGRNAGNHFINFNGTAGIWRKSCIIDAGNWQTDTLTEDLDLSYRAQMKGWKFIYLENVGSPAELPVTMNALKTQQFRWTKGAAECVKKNLPSVLSSCRVGTLTKIHSLFHLMNSTVYIFILLSGLISIPLLFIKSSHPQYAQVFFFASFSPLSLLLFCFVYWTSARQKRSYSPLEFIYLTVLFLSVSMGFSLHNSIALFEGYGGKKIPFIRTPKFNVINSSDTWRGNKYLIPGINAITVFEGLLAVYFLAGIFLDIYFRNFGLVPFHCMLTLGFAYVCYYSVAHSIAALRQANG